MIYESWQHSTLYRWDSIEPDELPPQRSISPGKRTLTMSIPQRTAAKSVSAQSIPLQLKSEPATSMARDQHAALTEQWMNVAMRPDLYGAPLQRKSAWMEEEVSLPLTVRGSGQPLPEGLRFKMEHAFGTDFSAVRIHEGQQATALGALAYTQGADIHFAPGQYDPSSQRGQELLGHELTHVVQQSQGRVRATTQAKGMGVSDDAALEREADELGARAARSESQETVMAQAPVPASKLGAHGVASAAYRSSHRVGAPQAATKSTRSHLLSSLVQLKQEPDAQASQSTPSGQLLFSSTLLIRHRLLKSRTFKVTDGGITVVADASWHTTADIGQGSGGAYDIQLVRRSLFLDESYANCTFVCGTPNVKHWGGLPEGEYQLIIWTNNTNPYRYLEGTIQVAQHSGHADSGCGDNSDSALEILHTALDLAGLIPALGVIPDALNAGIYLIEGDWTHAGISAAAMAPIFGQGVTVTKLGVKVSKEAVERLGKEGIEAGVKKVVKRSLKQSAEEAVSRIGADRIEHIMAPKHAWSKLMANPTWEKVAPLVEKTLADGVSVRYKTVQSKIMQHKGFQIQVTFTKIKDKIMVSDAWIITR